MPLFNVRELLPFPSGDNATDTIINGIHFNRTALEHFNYTLYDNGTLSNNSKCFLSFDIYQPYMFANGTFVNGTACDSPIEGIGARGSAGIAFASLFAATIMFTLINLRKHGRRFLPSEKRWRAVGRRWSWYWLIALAACGTISCFMSIDVDRDYLQGIAIILQSFFYYLMLPISLAAVWEAVRHWGSWQERQICDRDTFALSNTPSRDRQEFYLPLIFYLFAFLIFFMTIPRSWSSIPKQHDPQQSLDYAKPVATDGRFKAGSIMAIVCILIICYSLVHSIYWYKERPHSRIRSALFYLISAPSKFVIAIILASIHVGFNVASSFEWTLSPLKYDVNDGYLYGLGYLPMFLIIVVLNIYGYIDPNEDRALIAQRIERGRVLDAELGIEAGKRKPAWWKRLRPGAQNVAGTDPQSRLRALATEIGGGAPTTRNMERYVEMGNMQIGQKHDDKDMDMFTKPLDPFSDQASDSVKTDTGLHQEHRTGRMPSDAGSHTTVSSGRSRASQVQPQRVRSMLDI